MKLNFHAPIPISTNSANTFSLDRSIMAHYNTTTKHSFATESQLREADIRSLLNRRRAQHFTSNFQLIADFISRTSRLSCNRYHLFIDCIRQIVGLGQEVSISLGRRWLQPIRFTFSTFIYTVISRVAQLPHWPSCHRQSGQWSRKPLVSPI